jgi:plastocyanin
MRAHRSVMEPIHHKEVRMDAWAQPCRSRKTGMRLGRPLLALLGSLVFAVLGCGTHHADQSATQSTATQAPADSGTHTRKPAYAGAERGVTTRGSATRSAAKSTASPTEHHEAAPAAPASGHVRLVYRGCVQFEPQWIDVRAGESVTWESLFKSPVTIHVPPGAFDQTEFRVRPGEQVRSGPARAAGAYAIWTEPAACQGPPRGARGSSPGVMIGPGEN